MHGWPEGVRGYRVRFAAALLVGFVAVVPGPVVLDLADGEDSGYGMSNLHVKQIEALNNSPRERRVGGV
jgi:hypothetical protein